MGTRLVLVIQLVVVGLSFTLPPLLRKATEAGVRGWTKLHGTDADEWSYGVAADAQNVYTVGSTENENKPAFGKRDVLLVKYDRTGYVAHYTHADDVKMCHLAGRRSGASSSVLQVNDLM